MQRLHVGGLDVAQHRGGGCTIPGVPNTSAPRRVRPKVCRVCGKKGTRAHPISFRGKCEKCQIASVATAITEMQEKRGPTYTRWALGLAKSVEKELADLEVDEDTAAS